MSCGKNLFAASLALIVLVASAQKADELVQTEKLIRYINSVEPGWRASRNVRFENVTIAEAQYSLGLVQKPVVSNETIYSGPSTNPTSFDARTKWPSCFQVGIKDQSGCGGCWAFASSSVFGIRACIASNGAINKIMSAQYPISCDTGDNGCNGGTLPGVWNFYKTSGTVSDIDYPFTSGNGAAGTCALKSSSKKYYAASYTVIKTGMVYMQTEILNNGPIQVGFDVYTDFFSYKSGVYTHTTGTLAGGHSVYLVGWGVDASGTKYWIAVNSWGSAWGNQGTFLIKRGTNECNIELGYLPIAPMISVPATTTAPTTTKAPTTTTKAPTTTTKAPTTTTKAPTTTTKAPTITTAPTTTTKAPTTTTKAPTTTTKAPTITTAPTTTTKAPTTTTKAPTTTTPKPTSVPVSTCPPIPTNCPCGIIIPTGSICKRCKINCSVAPTTTTQAPTTTKAPTTTTRAPTTTTTTTTPKPTPAPVSTCPPVPTSCPCGIIIPTGSICKRCKINCSVAVTTQAPVDTGCPENWIRFGSSCFIITGQTSTWDDAQGNCELIGGYLAEIHSADENNFILNSLSPLNKNSVWLGCSVQNGAGIDLFGNPLSFSAWLAGLLPDGCGEQIRDPTSSNVGRWKTKDCSSLRPFVCEKAATN